MIFEERKFTIKGKELVLRSANNDDAPMLIDFLKKVTGETRFLMMESDEADLSLEDEYEFLKKHNESDGAMLIMGILDGEHVGNCSFTRISGSRRYNHRANVGIALLQKYTGLGIGRLMFDVMLEEIQKLGFEQAELTVIDHNDRAKHLYESLGFRECGRIPKANKYDDGTYADDILMVKEF